MTGLSTLVTMIANATLTKSSAGDTFRKVFVDSLRLYERGEYLSSLVSYQAYACFTCRKKASPEWKCCFNHLFNNDVDG